MKTFHFDDDGRIPNNPKLPLVVYQDALPKTDNLTQACRKLFEKHTWSGIWVNGVYPFHHYHSTAHEVLGVTGGSASIQFGGEQGEVLQLKAGDVVIIPAGVGHCRLDSSADFEVVGAYPAGQDWDLLRGDPADRPQALKNIQAVPLPTQDPVYGTDSLLLEVWNIKA